MTLAAILLLVALILFVVDAFGVAARINLQSLGLAFLTGALLLGAGAL